jgi:hypothetical protein
MVNDASMLECNESLELLQKAIQGRVPGILSYMSRNKWHVARITMADITGQSLHIEVVPGQTGHQPVNIQIGQPVGISFKYAYGKFLFDATVEAFEPSAGPSNGGGVVVVACPDQIDVIQRRSYYRVCVPTSLKVNVVVWHRSGKPLQEVPMHHYFQGRLVDLSAGGAQIAMTPTLPGSVSADLPRPDFKKGQYLGIRFTPLPYETPITINAQIRNILPTADGSALCLGLQLVGLEASLEGRQTLSRIAAIVDHYYGMNQTGGIDPSLGTPTCYCPESASS